MNRQSHKLLFSRLFLFSVCNFLFLLLSGKSAGVSFQTTSSEGMGGTGGFFKGDPSAVFLNPAASADIDRLSFYGDYSQRENQEFKASLVFPLESSRLSMFYARRDCGNETADFLSVGIARTVFEGAPDTYLQAGADIRIARSLTEVYSPCDLCGISKMSDSGITAALAVIVRPVPVIAFRLVVSNIRSMDKLKGSSCVDWRRSGRIGATIYLRDKIIINWDREFFNGCYCDNYGFGLRTRIPLEIMSGFSRGSVYGGVRADLGFIRAALSFVPVSDDNVESRISFEFIPETGAESDSD